MISHPLGSSAAKLENSATDVSSKTLVSEERKHTQPFLWKAGCHVNVVLTFKGLTQFLRIIVARYKKSQQLFLFPELICRLGFVIILSYTIYGEAHFRDSVYSRSDSVSLRDDIRNLPNSCELRLWSRQDCRPCTQGLALQNTTQGRRYVA